ncbi:hypothetical protein [Candidatus Cyanaurora vandensis]|uniref:hypothetical protein n=1 Tax=Candidatus Cyanaurora vandensis TaxID=2714958 RepID=UPI0025803B22|nr:hypothetical protein [Candidatus Cyanaurora vandensis]
MLHYLPQFKGQNWTDLLTIGKIPKTDSDITQIFAERDRLKTDIRTRIQEIRQIYQTLNQMVNDLYNVSTAP